MPRKENTPHNTSIDPHPISGGVSYAALVGGKSEPEAPINETGAPARSPHSIRSDALLTRDATATALTEAGFPISGATLATKATRGGGPPYRLFGRRPLYCWHDAVDWAQSRLSPPLASAAEASVLAVRSQQR